MNIFLQQMVTEPTRITDNTENILDLFFTNSDSLVNQVKAIPGIGDHETVFIESSLKPFHNKSTSRTIFKYHKADLSSINTALESFSEEFQAKLPSISIEEAWTTIKQKLLELERRFVPSKRVNGKPHKPWINRKVKALIRKREKLFTRMRRTNDAEDKAKYRAHKENFCSAIK